MRIAPLVLVLSLAACTQPRSEWPSLSFGPEIAATEAAAGEGVRLAPLPALSQKERRGVSDPAAYLGSLEADFVGLKGDLKARRAELADAFGAFAESARERREEKWLGAQRAVSNLSMAIERIPKIRARAALVSPHLSDPRPAEALAAQARELELALRHQLEEEKRKLSALAAS